MTKREYRENVIKYLYQVFINRAISEDIYEIFTDCDIEVKDTVLDILTKEEEIKEIIQKYIKSNWSLDRLGLMPITILYLGCYELCYTDVPHKVVINEAIELSKLYCDDKMHPLINGILDNIYHKYLGDKDE